MPPPVRAVIFDFNGTLSHDEPIVLAIFQELFAEQGLPLSERVYTERLAGLSDPEIVRIWLGADHPAVDDVIAERSVRYGAIAADGSTIPPSVRAAARYAASRVPVAVCSGAARIEIETVLGAAGLIDLFAAVVTADDVVRGKPDPEGYVAALAALGPGIEPAEVIAFEDTDAGIEAALAAGMRCVAVRGTLPDERLARAERVLDALSEDGLAAVLSV